MQTTLRQITPHSATPSSDSHQKIPNQTCSTSMKKEETSSPPSPLCYLTERSVESANVCVCVCVCVCLSKWSLSCSSTAFCHKRYVMSLTSLPVSRVEKLCIYDVCAPFATFMYVFVCLWENEHWCIPLSRRESQMSVSPFSHPTRARQQDDCLFSRVTNARTSIGFAGGRGILAVVRHLAHSLIEVIHTHPPALVVSNKPG